MLTTKASAWGFNGGLYHLPMKPPFLALILVLALTGCSWGFTERVPDNWTPEEHVQCTSTPWLALVDVMVPLSLLVTGNVLDERKNNNAILIGVTGLATLPLGIASAITGLVWTGTCQDAKQGNP